MHKCDGCRYKGEHQEMMFRPFGVCTKETNLIEAEKAYNAEKCPYKKTNANNCIFCGDEIPDDQAICNTCLLILDSLPPEQAKMLRKLIEDEKVRADARAAIQEIVEQVMITLEKAAETISKFTIKLLAAMEDAEDGK